MPRQRGEKKKREDDDPEPPRRSPRQRKRTQGPQPSTSAGTSSQEPEPPSNSVTWPSDVEHYGKELPSNNCKHLYFIRKRWPFNGQRSS